MVTDSEFRQFVNCLESIDPLAVNVPQEIDRVTSKWGPDDAKYLPLLWEELNRDYRLGAADALEREANNQRRFYCLDAIYKVDREPTSVPAPLADCLLAKDDVIRRMALKYIGRAKSVEEGVRARIDSVVWDSKAYIGTRILAYVTRCRIKRRTVGGDKDVSGRRTTG